MKLWRVPYPQLLTGERCTLEPRARVSWRVAVCLAAATPGPGGGSATPLLAQAAAPEGRPDLSLMNCVLQDGRVPLEAQMTDKHARQAQVGAYSSRKVRKHLYCGEGGSQVETCRQTHRQGCHRKPRELGKQTASWEAGFLGAGLRTPTPSAPCTGREARTQACRKRLKAL